MRRRAREVAGAGGGTGLCHRQRRVLLRPGPRHGLWRRGGRSSGHGASLALVGQHVGQGGLRGPSFNPLALASSPTALRRGYSLTSAPMRPPPATMNEDKTAPATGPPTARGRTAPPIV